MMDGGVVDEDEGNAAEAAKTGIADKTAREPKARTRAEPVGDFDAIDPEHLRLLEAVIFASTTVLTERQMADRLPEGANVKGLLKALRAIYAGRGVNLVKAGSSWGFRTAPDIGRLLVKERDVAGSCPAPPSRSWPSSPITSRSRAPRSKKSGEGISKGALDVFDKGWINRVVAAGHRAGLRPGARRTVLGPLWFESLKDLPGIEELRAAGLFDVRPAIDIYAMRGALADKANVETALSDGSGEEPTAAPLDPEGGDQA